MSGPLQDTPGVHTQLGPSASHACRAPGQGPQPNFWPALDSNLGQADGRRQGDKSSPSTCVPRRDKQPDYC